jgi:hypothetical protein
MKEQIEILFIQVHHRCKQFDNPPCVIQDNKIHIYMSTFFMFVHLINEWQTSLKPMITIPYKKIILDSFCKFASAWRYSSNLALFAC